MPRFAVTTAVVVALGIPHAVLAYDPSCGTGPGLRPCSFSAPPPPPPRYNPPTYSGGGSGYVAPQVNSRAARIGALHRRGVSINDYANTLPNNPNTVDRKIELYLKALRYWPTNRVFRANLAVTRAWKAYGERNNEQALAYQKEARRLGRTDKMTAAQIAHLEYLIAAKAGDTALALTKAREAAELAPKLKGFQFILQGYEKEVARKKAAAAASSVPAQQTCPFGTCNPSASNSQIDSTSAGAGNRSTSVQEQLTSAMASGQIAKLAPEERARAYAGCAFDNNGGCPHGWQVGLPQYRGRPRGIALASEVQIRALLKTETGKQLIGEELNQRKDLDEARDARMQAEEKYFSASSAADRAQLALEVSEAKSRESIAEQKLDYVIVKVEEQIKTIKVLE